MVTSAWTTLGSVSQVGTYSSSSPPTLHDTDTNSTDNQEWQKCYNDMIYQGKGALVHSLTSPFVDQQFMDTASISKL